MELQIIQNYYNTKKEEKNPLYKKDKLILQPGVTALVGCNGSGKTTIIRIIKDYCENNNIPLLDYNNLDNHGRDLQKALDKNNISLLTELMIDSEGERIQTNFFNHVGVIGKFFSENKGSKDIVITMDALDSGLSIDGMIEIKTDLFPLILKDNKNINVYIIISANAYEFARGENCLDVSNLEYIKFNNYEEYRTFIIESRKYKNKRYNHGNFDYQ